MGFLKSLGYGTERMAQGVLGGIEGFSDFVNVAGGGGLEAISSLGGLAPNAVSNFFKNLKEDALKYSITDTYAKNIEERYKPADSMRNITKINETAGALIPTMLGSYASGSAMLGQAVNALSSAGNAMGTGYKNYRITLSQKLRQKLLGGYRRKKI